MANYLQLGGHVANYVVKIGVCTAIDLARVKNTALLGKKAISTTAIW